MSINKRLQLTIRGTGTLLLLASFYFLGMKLWHQWPELVKKGAETFSWSLTISCAMAYGSSQFLLSTAWAGLLSRFGERITTLRRCHAIYGRTQIAKYIPGNLFHFAGRHLLGRDNGYGHVALMAASLHEVILVLAAVASVALGGAILFNVGLDGKYMTQLVIILIAISTFLILMKYCYPLLAKRFDISLVSSAEQSFTSHLTTQFALYLLFFILTSIVFVILARQVSGQGIHWTSTGQIVVLFSVAWIIGFITPGAPGGIGVREALLLFLLTPVIGEEVSLRTAFWFRGVTILGDGFFFWISQLGLRR